MDESKIRNINTAPSRQTTEPPHVMLNNPPIITPVHVTVTIGDPLSSGDRLRVVFEVFVPTTVTWSERYEYAQREIFKHLLKGQS